MKKSLSILIPLLVALPTGCKGVPQFSGLGEPMVVAGATFHSGSLPGGGTETVTGVDLASASWWPGRIAISTKGWTSADAYAVAFQLVGISGGYWSMPVGALDPSGAPNPTDHEWSTRLNVGGGVPPGNYTLRTVAIDQHGNGGTPLDTPVCVADPLNPGSCGNADSPDTVVSLSWDLNVDLDLVVVTPQGQRIDVKHPASQAFDDGGFPPGTGVFSADSDAQCVIDGRNAEMVTWQSPPMEKGEYKIYADLYSACQLPSVRFVLSVYRSQPSGDADGGTQTLVRVSESSGEMLAVEASGGAGSPLYIGSVTF